MTVRELDARIGARELAEWEVFAQFEPFGEEREDLRMGMVCMTIANSQRGKNTTPFKPNDFIPKFRNWGIGGKKQVVAEQVRAVMMQFVNKED